MQLVKSRHREIDGIVARVLATRKNTLQLFQYSDNREHLAFDVDLSAFRQFVWKKLLGSVRTKHDNGSSALLVDFTEPAARSGGEVIDSGERCSNSFESRVLCLTTAVFHNIGARAELRLRKNYRCGDRLHVWQIARAAAASSKVSSLRVRISSVGRPNLMG